MARIAFIGGTGPAGIGLAARLSRAGHACAIGSRDADRAREASMQVEQLARRSGVGFGTNDEVVADADVAFLTVRDDAVRSCASELATNLDGTIVVSMANPLFVGKHDAMFVAPAEGSLAEAAQRAAPGARVVSAFHEIHVRRWSKLDVAIDSDTLVCSDDDDAKRIVMGLARDAGVRPVDAGPLRCSRSIESFVAALITVNLRNRASVSYSLTGLADSDLPRVVRTIDAVPEPLVEAARGPAGV